MGTGRVSPRVLATICARGGSKGVPGKNFRELLGRPLLAYTVDCARACALIGHIVLSTDSDEIASVAESLDLRVPFRRPALLATDSAAKIEAIRHATEYVEKEEGFRPDLVVDLDVGVPLRTPEDVAGAIGLLCSRSDLDAVVTIYEAERNPYFNMVELEGARLRLVKQSPRPVLRRQDAPAVHSVSPSVFAWRRDRLSVAHLYEGRWGGFVVPRERAQDIDDEIDLQFVEFLMRRWEGERP